MTVRAGVLSIGGAASLAAAASISANSLSTQPPTGGGGPPPLRQRAPLPPGWCARYTSAAPAGGKAAEPVVAFSPNAAFALKPGETVYPGITPVGFEAVYEAEIKIPEAGKFRFSAEVQGGKVRLSVRWPKGPAPATASGDRPDAKAAAQPVQTDWLTIPAGTATIEYAFTRSGDSPARLRAMWEGDRSVIGGFVPEPILATAVTVPESAAGAVGLSLASRSGRGLLGIMGCLNCHEAGPAGAAAVSNVKGPVLTGVGGRLYHDWISKWVANPQKVAASTFMPSLFTDSDKDKQDIEAITQYLVSLGGPAQYEAAATEEKVLAMGKDLYHSVGCVACHGPLETRKKDAPFTPVAPLGGLAGKYAPAALAEFLHDPVQTHPRGGMPSLSLNHAEADLIATYLINKWGSAPRPSAFTVDSAKAKAGALAFSARGCAACHEALDDSGTARVSALKAKPLAQLRPEKGCLDAADTATPRYTFLPGVREALAAAIASTPSWTANPAPAPIDAALRTVDGIGCTTCHEYNGVGGVPPAISQHFKCLMEADLGDEGRLPPRLTGVGGKLNTPWMKTVLSDAGRARPYIAARMPQFQPLHLAGLAEGLAAGDGVWPNTDRQEPRASQELVQAGRRLVGDTGLNCISCHTYGTAPPTGTPGPTITAFAERNRYDWFARYVLNPQRFKPGTKMTNFYVTGTSAVTDLFGGDGPKQAEAMWAYFTLGEFMPAPAGTQQSQGLQIRVGDRPRVMRTFLKHAGSRGIAVGYPEAMGGVHFAFDAENCRLAEAWRGNFLDAAGAWAGRGGETVGGQGSVLWLAPKGWPLVVGMMPDAWPTSPGRENGYRFRGYTIDDRGIPTFLYDLPKPGELDKAPSVRERFEPVRAVSEDASPGLRRRFEVAGLPPGTLVWFNAGTAACRVETGPGASLQTAKHEDGQTWYGVGPAEGGPAAALPPSSIWFAVEITP